MGGKSSSIAKTDKVNLESAFQHQLRCNQCLNYLSVGPVMISANRMTLCGRCAPSLEEVSGQFLGGVVPPLLVYSTPFSSTPFSLSFFCPYKAKNGSQIAWHYDKYHPENVIKDHTFELPSVSVGKSSELIYFNVSNLLSFKISVKDSCVDIVAHYLNELSKNKRCCIVFQKNACNLSFDVKLTECGKKEEYLSVSIEKLKHLFSDLHDIVCIVNLGNEKVPDLKSKTKENGADETKGTTSDTPKVPDNPTNYTIKKDNERLKMRYLKDGLETCAKCEQVITAGIVFFCFDSSYCEKCFKTDGVSYAETDHLNSTIQCPCQQSITVLDCHKHKRVCGRRKYKCVACPNSFTFEQLRMHWHGEHPLVLNSPLTLTKKTLDVYWAVSGELFKVHFVWNTGQTYYVKVEAVDVYKDYNYDIYFNYEEWFGEEWVNKSLKLRKLAKTRTCTSTGVATVYHKNFHLALAEVL